MLILEMISGPSFPELPDKIAHDVSYAQLVMLYEACTDENPNSRPTLERMLTMLSSAQK
jgi:hypothetical protein